MLRHIPDNFKGPYRFVMLFPSYQARDQGISFEMIIRTRPPVAMIDYSRSRYIDLERRVKREVIPLEAMDGNLYHSIAFARREEFIHFMKAYFKEILTAGPFFDYLPKSI